MGRGGLDEHPVAGVSEEASTEVDGERRRLGQLDLLLGQDLEVLPLCGIVLGDAEEAADLQRRAGEGTIGGGRAASGSTVRNSTEPVRSSGLVKWPRRQRSDRH